MRWTKSRSSCPASDRPESSGISYQFFMETEIADNLIYRRELSLTALDVDRYQRLRMSALFRYLQRSAVIHTTELGCGKDRTLERGLLWVVARVRIEVNRLPGYEDTVELESRPGDMMHIIFPRHVTLKSPEGEEYLRATSLWMLADAKTRRMVFPARYGIEIPGCRDDAAIRDLPEIREIHPQREMIRTVRYSDIDINGHVNNTHYPDWLDDLFDEEFHRTHFWKSLQINYMNEIPAGSEVHLGVEQAGNKVLVEGRTDSQVRLRMSAEAAPV